MLAKLRQQKQREAVLNEQLYKFIALLTKSYPPSRDFNEVFRIEMFAKPNKKAFQEVIYYLFHILDPIELKKRVPSWPVFDAKREVQFRKEVLSYIKCLPQLYPGTEIPMVIGSQLVSPGGRKFIHLMLGITRLVVIKHLKQSGSRQVQEKVEFSQSLMEIPKVNPDQGPAVIELFKGLTLEINKETSELIISNQQKIKEITNEIKALATEKHKLFRQNQDMKNDLETIIESEGIANLTEIEDKVKSFVNIGEEANVITNIATHLCKNHNYLEHSGNLLQHFSTLDRTYGTKIYDVTRIPKGKVEYGIYVSNCCIANYKQELQLCKHLYTQIKLLCDSLNKN